MNDTNVPPPDDGRRELASPSVPDRAAEMPPERLAWIARVLALGLVAYAAVALALVVLSLRRGRLFDALIIVVVLLFTTPVILGYRRQALERHRRTVARRSATGAGAAEGRDER